MKKILEVQNLFKSYGSLIAVENLSFDVYKNEIFGLLGPNSSGKTTTINSILSLIKYQKGDIKIFNESMKKDNYKIKSKIGVVPQEIALIDTLKVKENIDFFASLYIDDKNKRKEYVDYAIEFTKLNDFTNIYPKKLSGGIKRRVNLAIGIVHRPKLLFLDEPTVQVDAQTRNYILDRIVELKKSDTTIIYTTHYMEEVQKICDRIMIMDKGKKLVEGTKDELIENIITDKFINIDFYEINDSMEMLIKNIEGVKEIQKQNNSLKINLTNDLRLFDILQILEKNNIAYKNVNTLKPDLNDVFLLITGKELK